MNSFAKYQIHCERTHWYEPKWIFLDALCYDKLCNVVLVGFNCVWCMAQVFDKRVRGENHRKLLFRKQKHNLFHSCCRRRWVYKYLCARFYDYRNTIYLPSNLRIVSLSLGVYLIPCIQYRTLGIREMYSTDVCVPFVTQISYLLAVNILQPSVKHKTYIDWTLLRSQVDER